MSDDVDDVENEDDADGEAKPKMGMVKLGLFIGVPVLVLIVGAVVAFMLLSGGGEEEHPVALDEHGVPIEDHGEVAAAQPEEVFYYALHDDEGEPVTLLVNIRGTDGRPMVLQLELRFQSSDPELGHVLEEQLPPIMDHYLAFLSELREDDLYGSAGMHRVRLELLRRINLAIEPSHVDQVLIQRFLIDG
jgi:flagellar FliL protein